MKEEKENENENILITSDDIEQMESDNKEEKYTTKEKIIYILKGISSIISSIFHIFGYYSIWALGFTTTYLISFRWHYNKNLDYSYSYCFIPLINISFSLTAPIGGYFEDKYGGKKSIILSNSFLCFSFLIMYFSRSIYLDFILMLLNGFSISIGFNITKKNACSFFMNKKALICSIINIFPNLFCIALIMYNEVFILNFDLRYPMHGLPFYEEKVFINYQKFILFEIGLLIFTCIASLLFYYQNDPKETIKFGFNEKAKNEEKDNANNEIDKIEKSKKKVSKKLKIQKAIKDKRTIRLIIMAFLFLPTINLINNNLRMDDSLYFLFGVIINIIGILSCLIFGLIGDLIQFRILFTVLSALLSLTAYYYVKNFYGEFTFLLMPIFISFIYNGFNIIFDSHIMKVYGMDHFIEMWGVIRASGAIIQIFGIIFNFSLDIKSPGYRIIYGITGVFSLISLGLGLFEKDDKFDYNN